jgi:ribonuclease H2 subunit A
LLSDVPAKARTEPVVMGIDEAGRGPSLGPMTYGAAFWAPSDKEAIPKGFEDSKALSPETRARLFANIKETAEIGFVLRVLHASEISRKSLQPDPCSLNVMSHDAAIQMVQAVLDAGVRIETCYVDTVGIPDSYRAKLDRVFAGHNIHFVVEKKADAKYAPCSAASVGTSLHLSPLLQTRLPYP